MKYYFIFLLLILISLSNLSASINIFISGKIISTTKSYVDLKSGAQTYRVPRYLFKEREIKKHSVRNKAIPGRFLKLIKQDKVTFKVRNKEALNEIRKMFGKNKKSLKNWFCLSCQ